MNILLAKPLSDNATLTGSTALGDNTVNKLQKMQQFRIFRTGLSSPYIAIDFGTAIEIDFIALAGHNGTSSGTVTIKAGATDAVSDYTLSNQDFITGPDLGYDKNLFAVKLATAQTYRYWRIEISDAGNPDGFLDLARLYMDKAFVPDINASYGAEIGFIDPTTIKRTISGAGIPLRRKKLRQARFSFDFLKETESFGKLYDFDMDRGVSKDVLYIHDMDDTTHFQRRYVYGIMEELSPITIAFLNVHRKQYTITEI